MIAPITIAQRDRLMAQSHQHSGISQTEMIERAGQALAELALRLAPDPMNGPIVTVAGLGEVGAVGMAATRHLHLQGVKVRLVVAGHLHNLDALTAAQYHLLQEAGLSAWALSLTDEEMATQAPIDWMQSALILDCLLDLHLSADPGEDVADLIRIINSTRRPIIAYPAPSGLGGDEGNIYSPCVKASATLALALPDRGLVEGWPVVGDVWLADVGIPAEIMRQATGDKDILPFHGEMLLLLGPARQLAVL